MSLEWHPIPLPWHRVVLGNGRTWHKSFVEWQAQYEAESAEEVESRVGWRIHWRSRKPNRLEKPLGYNVFGNWAYRNIIGQSVSGLMDEHLVLVSVLVWAHSHSVRGLYIKCSMSTLYVLSVLFFNRTCCLLTRSLSLSLCTCSPSPFSVFFRNYLVLSAKPFNLLASAF